MLPIDSIKTIFIENDSLFGFRRISRTINNENFEFPIENTFYG